MDGYRSSASKLASNCELLPDQIVGPLVPRERDRYKTIERRGEQTGEGGWWFLFCLWLQHANALRRERRDPAESYLTGQTWASHRGTWRLTFRAVLTVILYTKLWCVGFSHYLRQCRLSKKEFWGSGTT